MFLTQVSQQMQPAWLFQWKKDTPEDNQLPRRQHGSLFLDVEK